MKSLAILLMLALAALPARAQERIQEPVSLRLNWYLGGLHAPFYLGRDRGYYREEGLDLTINEGRGSVNTVQVVAAGSDTFGLADSSSVIGLAAKGAPVKAVMSLLNSTGFSVVSLAASNLRTPLDLAGKTVAISPGDPLAALFRAVAAHGGLDPGRVRFVQVDPAAKVATVLERRADALLGGADDQFFLIKYKGQEPAAMRFADNGANIVGMTIVTRQDLIRTKPETVRRFVRATVRSWAEAKRDPQAAADAALRAKPELGRQSTLDQLVVDLSLMDSPNTKGRIGWGAEPDWSETIALLKRYRDLETNADWTAFHTNEFVPE